MAALLLLAALQGGGCAWWAQNSADNFADDERRRDEWIANRKRQKEKASISRADKLAVWCARRGQLFVGEKYGRIAHAIECRAPLNDEERARVGALATAAAQ